MRTSWPGRGRTGSIAPSASWASSTRHFERTSCEYAPYFFAELGNVAEAEEQAAIDAGEIRATGIRYVGTLGGA